MSASERAAAEAAEREDVAAELAPDSGPGDPDRASSVRLSKESRPVSSSSERQFKVERAQKCLENAALVTKRIKERRRATAELLGKPFEEEEGWDTSSELASTASVRTGRSVAASDLAPPMSVQEALNIPGISESLANTLKQKEILMERIKQYKERSKRERPVAKASKTTFSSRLTASDVEEESMHYQKPFNKWDAAQLQSIVKEKETAISIMQVKMRAMETTILDLQEKISEKDSLIEAKSKATSLMSDNLSKKEKDSVNLLEDTRQQMTKMQENFIAMENEWKEEKKRLLNDIELKSERINHLEQANAILENSRFEISLAHSKLSEEIEQKNSLICDIESKLKYATEQIMEVKVFEEEKGSQEISNMDEMTKRIELLEQLNCQIRQTNFELENKLSALNAESANTPEPVAQKKSSPQVSRKRGKSASRYTSAKVKSPWSSLGESTSTPLDVSKSPKKSESPKEDTTKLDMVIQSLNKEIVDKEFIISQKESVIEKQQEIISQKEKEIKSLMSSKRETVDIGLTCDTSQPLSQELYSGTEATISAFEVNVESAGEDQRHLTIEDLMIQLKAAKEQIALLNIELEAANKNMVKVKSAHKLKLKQMQKTIDGFSKMSDSNAEVSKLSDEVNQLTQKVAELEEDKGNLQLHLVDYDSGRLSESDSHRRLSELEALADSRLRSISDLETQKFDLVQELHFLQQKNSEIDDKLADLQQMHNEHVCTEMRSVQLEEQLDQATAVNKELELVVENLRLDKEQSKKSIRDLQDNISELTNKLESYIQENIDLTDRLEKLSAEKVSSAESIEMVESLTVQEKLELEEYNKKNPFAKETSTSKTDILSNEDVQNAELNENLLKLSQESEELNRKIELFTQERHEVMEKMNKIKLENEDLHLKIAEVIAQREFLLSQVQDLSEEKDQMNKLNYELSNEIDKLKKEHINVLTETASFVKPTLSEDASVETESTFRDMSEGISGDSTNQDDKPQASKIKPVKQLTKEILKLKHVIKEREAEIADCQMKILSLEEQHQKQAELIKNSMVTENSLKTLAEENKQLKEDIALLKVQTEGVASVKTYLKEIESIKHSHDELQNVLRNTQAEYTVLISTRDLKIQELEALLFDYERKIAAYNQSLQQKDKDITEYLNQITQLNSVSQKLKSTIEVLEEEKVNDHNDELIKSLNMQILNFQSLLNEQDGKLSIFEDENKKLVSVKLELTEKNVTLENEIKKLYTSLLEKDTQTKELLELQKRNHEEVSKKSHECKERDEEIHEIKLQLRKESIENENLRKSLCEAEAYSNSLVQEMEKLKLKFEEKNEQINSDVNENCKVLQNKNKELMDKLKKFAANLKKKTYICTELESQVSGLHIEIEQKQKEIDSLQAQIKNTASLQQEVIYLSKELECVRSEGLSLEQNKVQELEVQVMTLLEEKSSMIEQQRHLENNLIAAKQEIETFVFNNTGLSNELANQQQIVQHFKTDIETLNKKIAEYEVEKLNNLNLMTKISDMESEMHQKQQQISDLLNQIETIQIEFNTFKFGHDAKIEERDLFIENLECEVSRYKSRIFRLEESISVMEDGRQSLERKADQLGSQLEEKQKAYCDYSSNEDELVNRLAVLMDHDRVVDKQLHEIEKENSELQNKIQKLVDDNQHLHKNLIKVQEENLHLKENSNRAHQLELDASKQRIDELETQIMKISSENQNMVKQHHEEINSLEAEFHTQIENNLKEKKVLYEKYEKTFETNKHLEQTLQVEIENVKTLKETLEEIHDRNRILKEKSLESDKSKKQDYTEQYVSEINHLQSIINKTNSDIEGLRKLQTESNYTLVEVDAKVHELNEEIVCKDKELQNVKEQLRNSLSDVNYSNKTIDQLKSVVTELQIKLKEQDFQSIGKVSELDIITTSSMSENSQQVPVRHFDMGLLESQIVLEGEIPKTDTNVSQSMIRAFEHDIPETYQKLQEQMFSQQGAGEEVIVPKKTYVCYDESSKENVMQPKSISEVEFDPFNSDEGWGLGETPAETEKGSYMAEVNRLLSENEKLKVEIGNSNTKLAKALKKLKELKLNNDRIMNDLKTATQISQLNLLDTTMEDELQNQLKELHQKVQDLTTEIAKEKREKDMLAKQNDLFKNANDRVLEMKEKLENEILGWKLKFKEANDKVSSFEWGENQERTQLQQVSPKDQSKIINENSLIEQIERENDELNALVDQLTKEISELSVIKLKQTEQISSLQNDLSCLKSQFKLEQDRFENETLRMKSVIISLESDVTSKIDQPHTCEKCEISCKEIEKLQMKLEPLNHDNSSLASAVKRLQSELEIALSQCTQYEDCNKMFQNEISKLKESLKTANENLLKNSSVFPETDLTQLKEECKTLNENCQTLKSELETLHANMTESSNNIVLYETQITDFENKTSKLNEENDKLLSTVTELRASIASSVDQRGYEVAEMWKQHLTQRESDFSNIEHELREQISAMESKYEHLLDNVQSSSQEETSKMIMMEQLSSLQAKLKDKEEHLTTLQSKFSETVRELEMLRSEMEDEKLIHENKLLNQQEESDRQQIETENNFKDQIVSKDSTIGELNMELQTSKELNKELANKLESSQEIIIALKNEISDLSRQISLKDKEIYQKIQEYNMILSQRNVEFEGIRQQLIEYERKIEELGFEKESELAILRLKIHDQSTTFEKKISNLELENAKLVHALTQKIEECTSLNKQLSDLNKTLEDDSTRMNEMRLALENQELEIVTLKDEIDNMQIVLESSAAKVAKHVTFASDTKPEVEGVEGATGSDQMEEAVPRAELDLALYMLHQRDMRCEELTMELSGLLEERDTLQLRLSDSLRAQEELRAAAGLEAVSSALATSIANPSPHGSVSGEPLDDKATLHTKLHELRSVRQSRDVRLRQDSERRELDMQLLQRDVARLPPEAADQLRQAHYTLSRDSQSASTVLLNWLKGKSTPKVVHM